MFDQAFNLPKVFLNKDFIGVWDNLIKDDFCDLIVKTLDESTQIVPRSNTSVKDAQLDIAAFNPTISNHIMCAVRTCLEQYIEWYPFLKNFNYHSTTCLLQKTKPTEGYHDWHSESNNIACANRTLVWSVYFNDVAEGGETEFLYQNRRELAKQGDVLIFPAGYTHTHRGNPPIGGSKYLITSWAMVQDND